MKSRRVVMLSSLYPEAFALPLMQGSTYSKTARKAPIAAAQAGTPLVLGCSA